MVSLGEENSLFFNYSSLLQIKMTEDSHPQADRGRGRRFFLLFYFAVSTLSRVC